MNKVLENTILAGTLVTFFGGLFWSFNRLEESQNRHVLYNAASEAVCSRTLNPKPGLMVKVNTDLLENFAQDKAGNKLFDQFPHVGMIPVTVSRNGEQLMLNFGVPARPAPSNKLAKNVSTEPAPFRGC